MKIKPTKTDMNELINSIAGIFVGIFYFLGAMIVPLALLNIKNIADVMQSERKTKLIVGLIIGVAFIIIFYYAKPSSEYFFKFSGWTIVILIGIALFKYFFNAIGNYSINPKIFSQAWKLIVSIIIGNVLLFYVEHPLAINVWNIILAFTQR